MGKERPEPLDERQISQIEKQWQTMPDGTQVGRIFILRLVATIRDQQAHIARLVEGSKDAYRTCSLDCWDYSPAKEIVKELEHGQGE